jgi:putative tricarboxylic transport membrane protein
MRRFGCGRRVVKGGIVMALASKRTGFVACVAFAALAGAAALTAVPSSAAENFYAGKIVTIIVPYGPGGGYDTWARLFAPYLKKDLGAAEVKIENRPGGGGMTGTNTVYSAAPDGLTLGDTNAAGDVFVEMAKAPGVHFKTEKFNWLAQPDDNPYVIAVHPGGPYKSFDDIAALRGGKTVLNCLAVGRGSTDYNAAVITMNSFDVPFHMIAAFKGSHEEKATWVAGNGDTLSLSATDVLQLGPGQERIVLLNAAEPFSKLPGVPTVIQEAQKHHLPAQTIEALTTMTRVLAMGHAFFAPPGVPADRLQALRAAFAKTLHDKAFIAKAEKSGLWVGYKTADKLAESTQMAFKHKAEFVALLKTS